MIDTKIFLTLILIASAFMAFGYFAFHKKQTSNSFLVSDRNVSGKTLTTTLVASCFGLWILIGPSEAATWGGIGACLGYALGQSLPFLFILKVGKKVRKYLPNAVSFTQYIIKRYGLKVFQIVLALTCFYLFIYICAEVTAIAKIVYLISNIPLWQTSLIIIISTLFYSLRGGLKISILTDQFQFWIIMIILTFVFYFLFFNHSVSLDWSLISKKKFELINPNNFSLYASGLTFFIAVFATNLFDQGTWQRIFAAKNVSELDYGFKTASTIIFPVIFFLGIFGLLAVSNQIVKDPSTIIFSFLLQQHPIWSYIILILASMLVMSSLDTLISALASLAMVHFKNVKKKLPEKNFYIILVLTLSLLVWYVASKGMSVLYLFLFADLLCCAAAVPVFYGVFNKKINGTLVHYAVILGLISGLLLFPLPDFSSSFINLLGVKLPSLVAKNLLFFSFLMSVFIPFIVIKILESKK